MITAVKRLSQPRKETSMKTFGNILMMAALMTAASGCASGSFLHRTWTADQIQDKINAVASDPYGSGRNGCWLNKNISNGYRDDHISCALFLAGNSTVHLTAKDTNRPRYRPNEIHLTLTEHAQLRDKEYRVELYLSCPNDMMIEPHVVSTTNYRFYIDSVSCKPDTN